MDSDASPGLLGASQTMLEVTTTATKGKPKATQLHHRPESWPMGGYREAARQALCEDVSANSLVWHCQRPDTPTVDSDASPGLPGASQAMLEVTPAATKGKPEATQLHHRPRSWPMGGYGEPARQALCRDVPINSLVLH